MKHLIKKRMKGMSLLEILLVVALFSILGVIITRSVLLTLRGSKRSESTLKVRENISYSLGVVERQLRNADSIVECPNPDTSVIDYVDEFGNSTNFSCEDIGTDGYIASSSARLTSDEVEITSCSFSCVQGNSANPPAVTVSISAEDADVTGIEGASVTTSTTIFLRTY